MSVSTKKIWFPLNNGDLETFYTPCFFINAVIKKIIKNKKQLVLLFHLTLDT